MCAEPPKPAPEPDDKREKAPAPNEKPADYVGTAAEDKNRSFPAPQETPHPPPAEGEPA